MGNTNRFIVSEHGKATALCHIRTSSVEPNNPNFVRMYSSSCFDIRCSLINFLEVPSSAPLITTPVDCESQRFNRACSPHIHIGNVYDAPELSVSLHMHWRCCGSIHEIWREPLHTACVAWKVKHHSSTDTALIVYTTNIGRWSFQRFIIIIIKKRTFLLF